MRRLLTCVLVALLSLGVAWPIRAQEVIDRIAVRIENDVILLSEVRELAQYQLFVEGKSESDAQIVDRLVDQWIVRNEAGVARFPQPKDEDVNRSLERLKRSFSSPEEFEERKKQSGLSDADVLRMQKSRLFLNNYLDSRFRPSIQIKDEDVENFYKTRVVPRAESRGQAAPTLEAARDFIQEALVQRAIDEQADRWLKESRSRVHVEILLNESKP